MMDSATGASSEQPTIERDYGCEYGCPSQFTKLELLQHLLNCPRHELTSAQSRDTVRLLIVGYIVAELERLDKALENWEDSPSGETNDED